MLARPTQDDVVEEKAIKKGTFNLGGIVSH